MPNQWPQQSSWKQTQPGSRLPNYFHGHYRFKQYLPRHLKAPSLYLQYHSMGKLKIEFQKIPGCKSHPQSLSATFPATLRPPQPPPSSSQDEEFQPEYHTMKKLKLPINRKRLRRGVWSAQENQTYLDFLIDNRSAFVDEATRRESRVFCQLSELLHKRRNPDQCRSHHQKIMAKLNSFDDLIAKIGRKITNKKRQNRARSNIDQGGVVPLKVEKEDLRATNASVSEPQLKVEEDQREVLQVIERDFYRVVVKEKNRILLQINQWSIASF